MGETLTRAPQGQRMTLSRVLEHLLARGSQERSSVTLTRNAKGDTQIEVVVRPSEHGEVVTVTEAAAKAVELYDTLRCRYPLASGLTASYPVNDRHEIIVPPRPEDAPDVSEPGATPDAETGEGE